MKISSHLHWLMKMWRTQISGLLKNKDHQPSHLLQRKIAFLKLLKIEDLKTPLENVKKMKTILCAGSPYDQWQHVKKYIIKKPVLCLRVHKMIHHHNEMEQGDRMEQKIHILPRPVELDFNQALVTIHFYQLIILLRRIWLPEDTTPICWI